MPHIDKICRYKSLTKKYRKNIYEIKDDPMNEICKKLKISSQIVKLHFE